MAEYRSILLIPLLGTLLAVSGIGDVIFSMSNEIGIAEGSNPVLTSDLGLIYGSSTTVEYRTSIDNWVTPSTVCTASISELDAVYLGGIYHIVYVASGSIFHVFSSGNNTWTSPTNVNTGTDVSLGIWGGNLFCAFSKNTEIFLTKFNGIWESAQQISNSPGDSINPSLSTISGRLTIVWEDYRRGLGLPYARTSTDGSTWSDETLLVDPNIEGLQPKIVESSGASYLVCIGDEGIDVYPGDIINFNQRVTVMEGTYSELEVDAEGSIMVIVGVRSNQLYGKVKDGDGWTDNSNFGLGSNPDLEIISGQIHATYVQGTNIRYGTIPIGETVSDGLIPPSYEEVPGFGDPMDLEYGELGSIFNGTIQDNWEKLIDALPLPESLKKLLGNTPWFIIVALGLVLVMALVSGVAIYNRRVYGSVIQNDNPRKPFFRKKKRLKNRKTN